MFKKVITLMVILAVIQGCSSMQYNGKLFKKYNKFKGNNKIYVSDRKNTRYYRGESEKTIFENQIVLAVREDKALKLEDIVESNIAFNKQQAEEELKNKVKNTTESGITTGAAVTTEGVITTEAAVTQKESDNEEEDAFKKKKKKVVLKEVYKLYLGIKYRGRDWVYINKIKFKESKTGEEAEIEFGRAVSDNIFLDEGVTVTGGVYENAFFTLKKEEGEKLYKIAKLQDVEITIYSMYDSRKTTRKLQEKEKKEIIDTFEFYLKIEQAEKERIKNGIADKEKADREKAEKEKVEAEKKDEKSARIEDEGEKDKQNEEKVQKGSKEEVKK